MPISSCDVSRETSPPTADLDAGIAVSRATSQERRIIFTLCPGRSSPVRGAHNDRSHNLQSISPGSKIMTMTRHNLVRGSAAIARTKLSVRRHRIAPFTPSPPMTFSSNLGQFSTRGLATTSTPVHTHNHTHAHATHTRRGEPTLGPRSSHMRQSDEQWSCARSHLRQPHPEVRGQRHRVRTLNSPVHGPVCGPALALLVRASGGTVCLILKKLTPTALARRTISPGLSGLSAERE
jgi:hypothetical protein